MKRVCAISREKAADGAACLLKAADGAACLLVLARAHVLEVHLHLALARTLG